MINGKKWFNWALVFLVCLSLVIIYGSNSQAVKTPKQENVSVKILNDKINKEIKLQTETKEADLFTSSKMLPFLTIEAIDVPIHKWANNEETLFLEELEKTELLVDEKIPAHLNVNSDVHKFDDHLYNFVITVEQFIQNEKQHTYVKTFMVDLENESFLSLADIFVDTNKVIELLTERIKKEGIQTATLDDLHNLNWTIHDDEFILYVNPGEQNLNNDFKAIKLPLIKLHNYLNEEYKDMLISNKLANEIKEIKEEKNNNRKLDPNGKYIALTFDDGPHASITNQVLETLKEYNAKATFFMLSKNVQFYPEIAKEVVKAGHEIGNHSITHVNLNAVNGMRMKSELSDSKEQIKAVTGIEPLLFRPPYGEYNQNVLDQAKKTKQSVVLWSVDSLDWKTRNTKQIYNTTIKQIEPGSIILLHDIHKTTADALPLILEYLLDEGYEFVTVSELIPLIDANGIGPYYGK